jgi:hypothetical protein
MKKLTPEYWANFEIEKKDKIFKEGYLFEELIGAILDLEYGPLNWKSTKKTRDGGKDFYFYQPKHRIWVECKNYNSRISLNVLSSTLIMAQIDKINEILIFSYSPLKKNAIDKLFRYGDSTNKIIRIFADEILEAMIIHYYDKLDNKFFKALDKLDHDFSTNNLQPKPFISCSIVKDPMLAYNVEDDTSIIPHSPQTIDFTTVLCLYVFVQNTRRIKQEFYIRFEWANDAKYFEVINTKNHDINIELSPYETHTIKMYFRPVVYKQELEMPKIILSINGDAPETIPFGKAKCNWIGECALLGSSYESVLEKLSNRVFSNHNCFVAYVAEGRHGTGKTRLLNEAVNIALKYGYRVINFSANKFRTERSLKLNWLVKELVFCIFDIPDIDDEEIEYDVLVKRNKSPIFRLLYDLIKLDTQGFNDSIFDPYIPILAEKLAQAKYCLAMDNVQFFPPLFVNLIEKLVNFTLIRQKLSKYAFVASFNKDYFASNMNAISLYWLLKTQHTASVYFHTLEGFSQKNEDRLFLNQLLHCKKDFDNEYAKRLLSKMDRNPGNIKHTLEWMQQKNILDKVGDQYVIADVTAFYEAINTLSPDMAECIELQWKEYLHRNPEKESLIIISAIYLLGSINDHQINHFALDKNIVLSLEAAGFIVSLLGKPIQYVFRGTVIERYFSNNLYPIGKYFIYHLINTDHLIDLQSWSSQYLYGLLVEAEKTHIPISIDILKNIPWNNLPKQFASEYVTELSQYIFDNATQYDDKVSWLKICTKAYIEMRNYTGTKQAVEKFNQLYRYCLYSYPLIQEDDYFGWFVITYCNLISEAGYILEAIKAITTYLCHPKWQQSLDNEQKKIKCYIYNREHVYRRNLTEYPFSDNTVLNPLENSYAIARTFNNDEIQYLNHSDHGYCWYALDDYKGHVLCHWRTAVSIFEQGNIPQKTMNYYRKRIQIELIEQRPKEAVKLAEEAISYSFTGREVYYFGYFTISYNLLYACAKLMTGDVSDAKVAFDKILIAEELDTLLELRQKKTILWLKALYYNIVSDYEKTLHYYHEAIEVFMSENEVTFRETFIKQIEYNAILTAVQYLEKGCKHGTVAEMLSKYCFGNMPEDTSKWRESHRAIGLVCTIDGFFNMPCVH